MAGKVIERSRDEFVEIIERLRVAGCDAVVLGCTEIPLLLGDAAEADDLINPAQLLAEAAVRGALDESPG